MSRIRWAQRCYRDERHREHRLEYDLLLEQQEGRSCYGVAVRDLDGDVSEVRDLTSRPERAEELFDLLVRGLVTPVTLRDVVEDFL